MEQYLSEKYNSDFMVYDIENIPGWITGRSASHLAEGDLDFCVGVVFNHQFPYVPFLTYTDNYSESVKTKLSQKIISEYDLKLNKKK